MKYLYLIFSILSLIVSIKNNNQIEIIITSILFLILSYLDAIYNKLPKKDNKITFRNEE